MNKKIILLQLLFTVTFSKPFGLNDNVISGPKQSQGLPVIFFHPMGESCDEVMKSNVVLAMQRGPYENPIYCVEYGKGP